MGAGWRGGSNLFPPQVLTQKVTLKNKQNVNNYFLKTATNHIVCKIKNKSKRIHNKIVTFNDKNLLNTVTKGVNVFITLLVKSQMRLIT